LVVSMFDMFVLFLRHSDAAAKWVRVHFRG